jgi:hypothetical protein
MPLRGYEKNTYTYQQGGLQFQKPKQKFLGLEQFDLCCVPCNDTI